MPDIGRTQAAVHGQNLRGRLRLGAQHLSRWAAGIRAARVTSNELTVVLSHAGEKATKWQQNSSNLTDIDGLTTNGVLLMHPGEHFSGDSDNAAGMQSSRVCQWREVSVCGDVYSIRETRSAAQKGTHVSEEKNVLQDGTLIDLCGATLMWRSAEGLKRSPTKKLLDDMLDELNASRPLCPVGLNTLVIPRKATVVLSEKSGKGDTQPYVYLKCGEFVNWRCVSACVRLSTQQSPRLLCSPGHVQGLHDWGQSKNSNAKTCPMCLVSGPFAKLSMGVEPSFYSDCEQPSYCFNPCGHMCSEKSVK